MKSGEENDNQRRNGSQRRMAWRRRNRSEIDVKAGMKRNRKSISGKAYQRQWRKEAKSNSIGISGEESEKWRMAKAAWRSEMAAWRGGMAMAKRKRHIGENGIIAAKQRISKRRKLAWHRRMAAIMARNGGEM
jgi:post-segregation antitoxin (ccd killing protein)